MNVPTTPPTPSPRWRRVGEKRRRKHRVGVHHEDGVVVLQLGQDDLEDPVERAGLLVPVFPRREHERAHRFGFLRSAVGAVVRAYDDEVGRRRLAVQRLDRRLDLLLLVVRGDQRDDERASRNG